MGNTDAVIFRKGSTSSSVRGSQLSAVLQNLPTPSGDAIGTRTCEEEHFYRPRGSIYTYKERVPGEVEWVTELEALDVLLCDESAESSRTTFFSLLEMFPQENVNLVWQYFSNWIASDKPKMESMPWNLTIEDADIPSDVSFYLFMEGLLPCFSFANTLVYDSFSSIKKVESQMKKDPEIEGEWVSLEVWVEGDPQQILDDYDEYTEQWVASMPWPDRMKIRLSFNVL